MNVVTPSTPATDLRDVQRRVATSDDLEAIVDLADRTMRAYVEATFGHWDEAAARASLAAGLDEGAWRMLTLDGAPLGVLRVLDVDGHVQLDEIFLEPALQNRGLGGALVREVLAGAHARGLPVRLRILRANPARSLYQRLGFRVERETPERLFMVCAPGG